MDGSIPRPHLYGPDAIHLPFGDGVRCVGGQTVRLVPPMSTNFAGQAVLQLDFTTPELAAITTGVPAGLDGPRTSFLCDPYTT